MKTLSKCLSILAALLVGSGGGAFADTPVVVAREAAQQQTSALNIGLNAVLQQLGQSPVIRAVPEGAQAMVAIGNLLNAVRELERQLAAAPMVTPQGALPIAAPVPQIIVQAPAVAEAPPNPPPPPAPPAGPTAVAGDELNRMLDAIRRENFSRQQLAVLEQIAKQHFFVIAQVQQVIGVFTFGRDKLQALRLLAPRILDKERAYELNQAFTFDREKREAAQILGQ